MEWYHVLAVVLGNLAVMFPLWLWNRGESRADTRHMDSLLKSNRDLIYEIRQETHSLINAIHLEMKDFHNKLCNIESNREKK